MRYILLFLLLTVGGCQTTPVFTEYSYTQVISLSSDPFIKAKYFTELAYITKDKQLVKEFKDCYTAKKCHDPKFKALRKWAAGKERKLVLETLDIYLKANFEGK
jgi:hypothetical protein